MLPVEVYMCAAVGPVVVCIARAWFVIKRSICRVGPWVELLIDVACNTALERVHLRSVLLPKRGARQYLSSCLFSVCLPVTRCTRKCAGTITSMRAQVHAGRARGEGARWGRPWLCAYGPKRYEP